MNYLKRIWLFLSSFKHYLLSVYVLFVIKLLLIQPTLQTAANLLVLGGVYCFIYWMDNKRKIETEEDFKESTREEINDIKSKLARVNLEFQQSKRK
ncbi:MAG TPA: hypothetical protein VI911_08955 [Patescibacteria group bacterium]|nr:MAG: hypothetical protein UR43_C0005G0041 [candidate division TM6 bacterium GW2011_GWF2_33_332]HLD91126.1 hypothetical protein [Patescibacteria group bacterium]